MEVRDHAAWPCITLVVFCVSAVLIVVVLTPARLELPTLRRKVVLCVYGATYLALSRDSQFQLPPDPGKSAAAVAAKKRIVFVRHGESAWNECFNRSFDVLFPIRLLLALLRELSLLLCVDSVFFDSPLSQEGLEQAQVLERFVEGDQGEELRRLCESAVFVSSSLRRAAATALVAFARCFGAARPLWVLSCLQEISRNIDTLALTAPYCTPQLRPSEAAGVTSAARAAVSASSGASASSSTCASRGMGACLQGSYNFGNKDLQSQGDQRLEAFCDWVFSPCSPAALQPNVIVAGHSLWFRTFFQAYLPHTAYHECKHAKIVNCGVVVFDLERLHPAASGGRPEYRIVADSVATVYGGFEQKPAKGWARMRGKRD